MTCGGVACTVRTMQVEPVDTPVARSQLQSTATRLPRLACILLLLLLACCVQSACGLSLSRATVRTRVLALDSSIAQPGEGPKASADPLTAAKVAVLTLTFDAPVWTTRDAGNGTETVVAPVRTGASADQLHGLARLICGRDLFDSHPPRDGSFHRDQDEVPRLLPGFMLLTPSTAQGPWSDQWPLLALLDEAEHQQGEEEEAHPSRTLRAFLVLGSSRGGVWTSRIESPLDRCEIRILDRTSQSWLPTGALHSATSDEPLVTRQSVALVRSDGLESAPLRSVPIASSVVRSLLRSMGATRDRLRHARPSPNFIETGTGERSGSAVVVDASVQTGVKFAGLLKGIITGLLTGLATPMGNMVGDFTADGVLDPVADKVLDGLSDAMQAGLPGYITGDVVVQVIPGVCETVTAALTESTARAIAEAVVRGTTEMITTDVTTRVTHTIVDPTTLRSSQMIAVKLARMLHNSLTHMLSRSVPHIIVPALLNTVSVGLKEDYYCYFCNTKQMYCIYCNKNRGDTMNRLYYALYYTGYHSSYYSNWYASQRKFGVLMVQKRQLHPLDDITTESENAWAILGREGEDGTQTEAEEAATVVEAPLEDADGDDADAADADADGDGADAAAADGADADGADAGAAAADGAADAAGGDAAGGLGGALGGAGGALGGAGGALGGLTSKLGGLQGKLTAAVGQAQSKLGGLTSKLGGLQSRLGGLTSKLGGLSGGLTDKLGGLSGKLEGLSGGLTDKLGGLSGKLEGLSGGLTDKLGGLSGKLEGLSGGLTDKLGGLSGKLEGLSGGLSGKLEGLSGGLTDKLGGLSGQLEGALGGAGGGGGDDDSE